MAVEDQKLLLVVGIHEGRGFPSRLGYLLLVEARLSGEALQCDPVEHSNLVDINNELAWEMTKRSLHQNKLHRTPIKIVCYSVNKSTKKKQEMGYIILDLRSVSQQVEPKVTHWHGLLNSQYNGKRPELRISMTVEIDSTYLKSSSNISMQNSEGGLNEVKVEETVFQSESKTNTSKTEESLAPSLTMTLDKVNGWYTVGSPSELQVLYTVSLTLTQPKHFHKLSHEAITGPYYFQYTFLGNPITTEKFSTLDDPCDFCPERASVRLKIIPALINSFFAAQQDIEVQLCTSHGEVTATTDVPFSVLSSASTGTISCHFESSSRYHCHGAGKGSEKASIDVILTLMAAETKIGEKMNISSAESSVSSSHHSSSSAANHSYASGSKVKRNLTESLNQASLKQSSPSSPSSSSSSMATPPHASSPQSSSSCDSPSQHVTNVGQIAETSPLANQKKNASTNVTPLRLASSNSPSVPMNLRSPSQQVYQRLLLEQQHLKQKKLEHHQQKIHLQKHSPKQGQSPRPSQPVLTSAQVSNKHNPSQQPPAHSVHQQFVSGTSEAFNPYQLSSVAQQHMEYQTAMELELWKITQEQAFMQQLKEKEETRLKLLGDQFQKRDRQREEIVKQKLSHYKELEEQLSQTLLDVESQRQRLKERETKVTSCKKQLEEEKRRMEREVGQTTNQVKSNYEAKLEIEKLKTKELNNQVEQHKKQCRVLEEKLLQKEAEFESFKEQVKTKPETRLQTELSLLRIEKNEVDSKVAALVKSKQHYKEQWSKALREIAYLKQKEQTNLKEQLKEQQEELEQMRRKYVAAEEQKSLQKELADIKLEAKRLQSFTAMKKPTQMPTLPPLPTLPTHPDIDSNIARLIEERDILLQTGVYDNSDPTIQKLDDRIRAALATRNDA